MWENTTPSTELPLNFCAEIGPLQVGVVLVLSDIFLRAATSYHDFIPSCKRTLYVLGVLGPPIFLNEAQEDFLVFIIFTGEKYL